MDSHVDSCVFGSNVLSIHDHGQYVNIYDFAKETKHSNACTIDAAIAYEDPIKHSIVIIMINQAI